MYALTFGVHRVKGQRALPGAGGTGNDHQLVARDIQVHVFEVVLPRPRIEMVLAGAMGCDSRACSALDSGQLRLRMEGMLSFLLAVDATIVSESSSIDLIGSVGLAFEGA